MPKKKLLIISLSAGAGHIRAAEALRETAELKHQNWEVSHIDLKDYISRASAQLILKTYDFTIKRAPIFWKLLYEKTNDEEGVELIETATDTVMKLNAFKLYHYIRAYKPDHIISTHSLPGKLVRLQSEFDHIPLSMVVTDYDIHRFWLVDATTNYFIGSNKIAWKLKKLGVHRRAITESGIPVSPVFFQTKSKQELQKTYRISADAPVILLLSGGQGLGKSDDLLRVLADLTTPCTIIAIAGTNKALEKKLKAIRTPSHISTIILGWTNAIDDYMRLADIIVSKPGGLTSTECLTLGKWLIATSPIPGQEEANVRYLLEHHAGDVAYTFDDLLYYTEERLRKIPTTRPMKRNGAETILRKVCE